MISLAEAKPGHKYEIKWNVSRSLSEAVKKSFGLAPGDEVYLIHNYFGDLMLRTGGRKIAINRDLAYAIKV